MSRCTCTKSKGVIGTLAAMLLVIIIGTIFLVAGYFGIFNFKNTVVRIVLREYLDTKIFSLLSSTTSKYSVTNLLGYGILLNQESLTLPAGVNLRQILESRLKAIETEANRDYLFYISYAGNKYFEILSDDIGFVDSISTYHIPLPYNEKSLVAEVKWSEW